MEGKMKLLMLIVLFAVILAVSFAALNFYLVRKMKEGTERMQEIAAAIREGANAFIRYEYKIVAIIGSAIAILLGVVISWETGVSFVVGAVMSAMAGLVGMKIATYANVRVANEANNTRNTGKTVKVAFRGGSVMGLCVAGFALLGILIVYFAFGVGTGMLTVTNGEIASKINPITGQSYTLSLILSGYALGCSIIAMFNRVGGGIYTKAADMGADLVGKTEAHIPEDDPRNPATIADNVGDNVGDVAGLGADLLESYVGSIMSCAILAIELFTHSTFSSTTLYAKMIAFPILFAGIGLIACVLGIAFPLVKKKLSDNPHFELNLATWISAGLAIVLGFVLCFFLFNGETDDQLTLAGFKLGKLTPWIAATIGIAVGIIIGIISEYYTSYDFKPTKKIAQASKEGPALTITQGMATGMISCMLPVVCLGAAIFACYLVGGMYGVGCGAVGMLCFVATTVSVDSYGPISDNAGGIAEMSELDKDVRNITDKLDSVGNTTAAIGKGFCIGSATLTSLAFIVSFIEAVKTHVPFFSIQLNDPKVLVGMLVGAMLPYLFSAMTIASVGKAANKMVEEVRSQFEKNPEILEGKKAPDYNRCIDISTKASLREMIAPGLLAILAPVVAGLILGAAGLGGLLIGGLVSAIMLAVFMANAGGAWDNAKKFIEAGNFGGKGSDTHKAAITGDTVGDPLKDTAGPAMDILIKLMSVISLIIVPVLVELTPVWDVIADFFAKI